jgi:hypothetical protein
LKTIFLLLVCGLFSLSVFGQSEEPYENNGEVTVKEISLARDDGKGKAGQEAASFKTTDIPIHCSVQLSSIKAAIVKMNFVAVKVAGVRPETKVVTVSYKTNGKQNRVNFSGAPEGFWTAGNYRIDIFVDGKAAGNKAFEIQSSAAKIEAENFAVPAKNNSKPKPVRRPRKN